MTQLQLPAHLQGRVATGVAARAVEGMGSSLPPHISIQGNKFTFIDASGNEAQPMLTFDGYIIDVSDYMNKRYYDKKYDQNATTYEPPVCWSSNGIGPSREAAKPQSMTCESCDKNVRGSATSQMSGAAIKACRDEKWLAIINPNFGAMVFQLIISPGSFKNWKAFVNTIENYQVEPSWVLTRFMFEDRTNGVLSFSIVSWTSPEHLAVLDGALAEKKTDLIVGRLDQVRTAALPAPSQPQPNTAAQLPPNQFAPPQMQQAPAVAQQPGFGATQQMQPVQQPPIQQVYQPPQQEIIPPGAVQQAPFGAAPGAGAPPMQMVGQPPQQGGFPSTANAAGGFPSEQQQAPAQPTQRRRRNANANAAPPQGTPPAPPQGQQGGFQPAPAQQGFQPSAPPPGAVQQAPFGQPQQVFAPPAAPPANPTTPGAFTAAQPGQPPAGNSYGIGGGAPVNPDMSAMLTNLFQPQQPPQ